MELVAGLLLAFESGDASRKGFYGALPGVVTLTRPVCALSS